MTLYKDIMRYFDKFYTGIWLKSEHIMVPLKGLDAQKVYNCQILAPSFLILAKTLLTSKNEMVRYRYLYQWNCIVF